MSENQMNTPILQIIASSIKDGVLPKGFSLPKEKAANRLTFADGAMDGIKMYHMQLQPVDIEPVTRALVEICNGKEEEATAELQEFVKKHGVIEFIDALHKWIFDHHDEISAKEMSSFAIRTLMLSDDAEMIKLGLAILELLSTDKQEELKKVIRMLALCDEFTIYCLFIMHSWTNPNYEIFDLMQKVHGWGKIHCVAHVEADNTMIRKWLLDHGCENSVAPAYSALTVAKKCDVIAQLKRTELSQADWDGLMLMLQGLMEEGPVAGISSLEEREELFTGILDHASGFEMNMALIHNLISMAEYIDGEKVKMPEIRKRVIDLLNESEVYVKVSEAMEEGKGFEEALKLGIPYEEKAMNWLKKDPIANCMVVRLLMASRNVSDEVVALYTELLPLEEMASGPSDVLGLGKEYQNYHALAAVIQSLRMYPGKGVKLLKTALLCPVVSCRSHALDTLEGWVRLNRTSIKGLAPELVDVLKQAEILEVKEELKKKIRLLK